MAIIKSNPYQSTSVDTYLFTFVIGLLSYLPAHYLSGIMGSWKLPSYLTEFMRDNGNIAIIIVDLFVISLPMFLTYLFISLVWFGLFTKKALVLLIIFSVGWLLPSTIILYQNKDLLAYINDYPYIFFVHFMPLIGVGIGYVLLKKNSEQGN